MSIEIKIPELGEGIDEGTIVKLHVKPGDTVSKDQILLELETGKATLEVPSDISGTVTDISVNEGDTVEVGRGIMTLSESDGEKAEPETAVSSPREQPPEPISESKPEPKPEQETPSPTRSSEQPPESKPEPKPAPKPEPAPEPESPSPTPPISSGASKPAAPAVRGFARSIGVPLDKVQGSGLDGQITMEDIKAYAAGKSGGGAESDERREKMSAIRKATAEHMAWCWATIPHVTQHDVADVTELEILRKKYGPKAERAGGKLTVTAILLKIAAASIKVYPKFASSVDMETHEIIYKNRIHIGVAVDTEKGLLVPVVRDVDQKNIVELAVELSNIAQQARDGKLAPDDLKGGVFTITNVGGIGGTFFTPIVNAPEVAILGIGRASTQTRCDQDGRPCRHESKLPLSLSYDHRVIDGADGARFLHWIVEAIEEPLLISLEG